MRKKAKLVIDKRVELPDGCILEMVVWELPVRTKERPHGYKYRLQYSLPDGSTLVRYDNHVGKAEHKHIQGDEYAYEFRTLEQTILDFISDVQSNGGHI